MEDALRFYSLKESIIQLKQQSYIRTFPQLYISKNKLTQITSQQIENPLKYKPMPFEIVSLSEVNDQKDDSSIIQKEQTLILNNELQTPLEVNLQLKAKKCMSLLEGQSKHEKEQQIMSILEIIKSILNGKKERTNQRLKKKLIQTNKSPQQAIQFLKSLRKNRIMC
ncbi:unnamed protein product (macronuclear) [Paramecium tetraurelia]|uniref:Uncharacterized protein n=1 Tax=Paramecium tetraurelia TaxID=5888 RepID=A0C7E3_PARTE|nr:uncharacterized protein GSPATT00035840001 [Paramecium tetraurelia]CAK66710.1 unnamed protein product [Paramecium tetraurelia]|eukprot:XP_001434107.1 hypothetical protein (macronuclear) [Paramecium tetraurelia strain d4-2]